MRSSPVFAASYEKLPKLLTTQVKVKVKDVVRLAIYRQSVLLGVSQAP
jgi:hypothetical protein